MTQVPEIEPPQIRTPVRSKHINVNGHAFGGWIFSQMDHAACLTGERLSKGQVTTVAVNDLRFIQPVPLGDRVSVYCRNIRPGRTSVQIDIEVVSENQRSGEHRRAATATFVLVAIDQDGRPRALAG